MLEVWECLPFIINQTCTVHGTFRSDRLFFSLFLKLIFTYNSCPSLTEYPQNMAMQGTRRPKCTVIQFMSFHRTAQHILSQKCPSNDSSGVAVSPILEILAIKVSFSVLLLGVQCRVMRGCTLHAHATQVHYYLKTLPNKEAQHKV